MISRLRARLAYALRCRLGFPFQELALARLKKAGFTPRVVLDVGASYGVFADEVWKLWPQASIHCFEPEPEYIEQLKIRAETNSMLQVCQALVGARRENQAAYFHSLGASSVLVEHTDDSRQPTRTCGPERICRMITLDDYCAENGVNPDFLKADVQGYELEVFKGCEKSLPSIEVILTEVNHIDIYQGAPLAAELIEWLSKRGYVLHDICNFMRRPLDGALWQTDMVFVQGMSPLRACKRYESSNLPDISHAI